MDIALKSILKRFNRLSTLSNISILKRKENEFTNKINTYRAYPNTNINKTNTRSILIEK